METSYSGPTTATQSEFSRSYTAFLDQFTQAVIDYLNAEKGLAVTSRTWDLNQNSSGGVPFLVGVDPKYFEDFFVGNKQSFSWFSSVKKQTVEHTRYFFSEFKVPDPWGSNAFKIDGTGSATGAEGPAGANGKDGSIGDSGPAGADGPSGNSGQPANNGQKVSATTGQPGTHGLDGEDGSLGGAGQAGGDGGNGTAAIVIDPAGAHGAILIDATGQSVTVIGGKGGDGGDGGAGGAGGPGGDGGDGGAGGAGGAGSGQGDYKLGAAGGNGGAAGSGGDGGDGGNGGNGGKGGDGANAIVNGSVSKVFIIGHKDVIILGGAGGEGGAGGAAGAPGEGGAAGLPGNPGAGGASTGQNPHASSGIPGAKGQPGAPGEGGLKGEDGLDGNAAAAFSHAVSVDATRFTGNLTISGSDFADSFKFGSGSSTVHATTGSDTYILNKLSAETFVYTDIAQSSGTDVDSFRFFNFGQDRIDLSDLWHSGSSSAWSGNTLLVDIDGGGADMEFMFHEAIGNPMDIGNALIIV
ncbi:M10 family metallopeptidase C-terminal domain-containing protein [Limimaricola soesokkakensis]